MTHPRCDNVFYAARLSRHAVAVYFVYFFFSTRSKIESWNISLNWSSRKQISHNLQLNLIKSTFVIFLRLSICRNSDRLKSIDKDWVSTSTKIFQHDTQPLLNCSDCCSLYTAKKSRRIFWVSSNTQRRCKKRKQPSTFINYLNPK